MRNPKQKQSRTKKPTLTKLFSSLDNKEEHQKLIIELISFLEYDEVLNLKHTNHFFNDLINKKIIKHYAQRGCITSKTRRLYYCSMIDIKETQNLILNELIDYKITTNFYENILRLSEAEKEKNERHRKVCEEIGRDITRTFYTEKFINGKGQKMLNNILTALAFIRPEIGYCQGMNFIAGALIELLNEEKISFYIFLAFIDKIELNLLYLKNMPDYLIRVFQLEYYTKKYFPELFSHFKKNSISPDIFFSKWILTIFASYLPFDILYHIWDVFILDKWKAIFKFSMSFFDMMHDNLLKMDLNTFSQFFRTNKINTFLKYKDIANFYIKFKITNKELESLREDFYADQVKLKLEDPNSDWEPDQTEFVDKYKRELEKHLIEVNEQTVEIKEKIEKLNKDYEAANSAYEAQVYICDNLKLKVEVLIETKTGYENVLGGIKKKPDSPDKKKPNIGIVGQILGRGDEKDKIEKKLKGIVKDIESMNKLLLENYQLLDSKKYKVEKIEETKKAFTKTLDVLMKDSAMVQNDLIRNLSQKLKLTSRFVKYGKY